MTMTPADADPRPQADVAVFSTFHGLKMNGGGALAGVDERLFSFRNAPAFEDRRVGSVAFFARPVLTHGMAGRLLGVFRIARDSAGRPGCHGCAALVAGRDEDALDIALEDLARWSTPNAEERYKHLTSGASLFPQSRAKTDIAAVSPNAFTMYGAPRDGEMTTILPALWRMSWVDDSRSTIVAFGDADSLPLLDQMTIRKVDETFSVRMRELDEEERLTTAPGSIGSPEHGPDMTSGALREPVPAGHAPFVVRPASGPSLRPASDGKADRRRAAWRRAALTGQVDSAETTELAIWIEAIERENADLRRKLDSLTRAVSGSPPSSREPSPMRSPFGRNDAAAASSSFASYGPIAAGVFIAIALVVGLIYGGLALLGGADVALEVPPPSFGSIDTPQE